MLSSTEKMIVPNKNMLALALTAQQSNMEDDSPRDAGDGADHKERKKNVAQT